MKILELTRLFSPSLGGMEKFVDDRLKIYQSLNLDYQVITTINTTGKQLTLSKQIENVTYLISHTPYIITPQLKSEMDGNYDILSVNEIGYFYSDYAIRKAFREGKKIVLTPHYFFHTDKYRFIKDFHSKFILPKTLEKIDKLICFTKTEKQFWVEQFPYISDKIEIIPHYAVLNNSGENSKVESSKNYFLYIGRGSKNKRTDLLIEAFKLLKTDYQLYLTIDKDDLPKLIQNLVMQSNNIHLLGSVSEEEKNDLFKNCSALIFPSDYEAFGIVNFEASRYCKPLIVSRLKVFEEILDQRGVLVFENTIQSIKEKMEYFLLLSREEKNKMGIMNFKNLEKYSFEKIKKDYENLINHLSSYD